MPETVGDFLKEHSLSKYADAFEEHGWDSLSYLQAISDAHVYFFWKPGTVFWKPTTS